MMDGYGGDSPGRPYQDYDGYDERWRDNGREMRSPPKHRQKRGYSGGNGQYRDYPSYGRDRSPAGGGTYGSPPDPYASPPDDSSEDEFSETLYSLVGDELMDPNVSAAEKEVRQRQADSSCVCKLCTLVITYSYMYVSTPHYYCGVTDLTQKTQSCHIVQ